MTLIWITVFIISLFVLVKGADWMLESSERIGVAIGLSPFIIGVIIVGAGTSFPEVATSIAAVIKGALEVPVANAVGSNIANIFLVVGIAAVLGRKLVISKNLIDLDIPLLAITTVIFIGIASDGEVGRIESLILIISYIIYLLYTVIHEEEGAGGEDRVLPSSKTRRHLKKIKERISAPKIAPKDLFLFISGTIGLVLGAKYLIDATINLSQIFNIGTGVITITAIAVGTSLPELFVSARAALNKKTEMALGNIFGSNVFNILLVVGLPGLFRTLEVGEATFSIGLPTLGLATLLFVISGISQRIHLWEGALYLVAYGVFVGKLIAIF